MVRLARALIVLPTLRLAITLYLPLCHSCLLCPSAIAGAPTERNIPPSSQHSANFLSEGVRCGLDKEIALDGTYLKYFPFRAMIERSQMTPYHKKLILFDNASPVTSNLIAFVVLTVEDYGVSTVAIVDKLGSTTLYHCVVLVTTC